MKCYFDTSVLVPATVMAHPHHQPALSRIQELIRVEQRGVMSSHGLMEFYSVLTRTPFQPPLHPSEVWRLIENLILPHMDLVSLTAKEYVEVTKACSLAGWTGGRVYDAVHIHCAKKSHCDRIYTFNVTDFRRLAPPEMIALICSP